MQIIIGAIISVIGMTAINWLKKISVSIDKMNVHMELQTKINNDFEKRISNVEEK